MATASSRLIDTTIIHVFMRSPLGGRKWAALSGATPRHASEVARGSVAPNGTKVLLAPTATCAKLADRFRHGLAAPFALSGQHARVPLRARARAPAPGHARRRHRRVAA